MNRLVSNHPNDLSREIRYVSVSHKSRVLGVFLQPKAHGEPPAEVGETRREQVGSTVLLGALSRTFSTWTLYGKFIACQQYHLLQILKASEDCVLGRSDQGFKERRICANKRTYFQVMDPIKHRSLTPGRLR